MENLKQYFPSFQHDLLTALSEHAEVKEFKEGETLMRAGQYVKHTVLVIKGKIKIYREDDDDGSEFFMYYLQPGQACAISMICATKQEKSQITAKVTEDATLAMVPLALMDKWMMQYRTWYEFVIDTYRKRFEEVLQVTDSIAFRDMDQRLLFYLRKEQQSCNCSEINVSHQEIANDLNTSSEVISRLLKMEQRNLIKLNRNMIEILG
jgi:CRP/FNR family transcriptional regulator, anaerobic regulatory protein